MLPDGWRQCRFGEIATFRNGLNFTRADSGEAIKIVGVSDFQQRSELADTSGLSTIQVADAVADSDLLKDGDLLFVRSNGAKELVGRCLYFPRVTERLAFSGFTIRARIEASLMSAEFAANLMRSDFVREQMRRAGGGTNINNLSQEILSTLVVPVPPRDEQIKIAHLLSTWDQAIATSDQLTSHSRSLTRALANGLLNGRRRLPRFGGNQAQRNTPHGQIPSDWQYPRIEEIADEASQRRGTNEHCPVLSCTKHAGLVDSLTYFNKQVFSLDTSTYKLIPRGCFVYATNHIEEGSIGYQDLYDFGLVSPMYTAFTTRDTVIDGYLYRLLKTEHYRQIFAAATNASVDRRGSLRWNEFKKLHVPLPTLAEQQAIAEVLDTADREIEVLSAKLNVLRREKHALMSQLLTGKRPVRLPAPAETVA